MRARLGIPTGVGSATATARGNPASICAVIGSAAHGAAGVARLRAALPPCRPLGGELRGLLQALGLLLRLHFLCMQQSNRVRAREQVQNTQRHTELTSLDRRGLRASVSGSSAFVAR